MTLLRAIGLPVAVCLLLAGSALGQVSIGGTPVSFGLAAKAEMPKITMPGIDLPALLAEDEIDLADGLPYRFGFPFDVNYTLENSGVWETLDDGSRLWRLKIECPGAYSINLLYNYYDIPDGARLFVYSGDQEMVRGAFTAGNIKDHREFATAPIKGDVTILEYHEPADVAGQGRIEISRIVHGYIDIFNFGQMKDALDFGESGSCNNNVNCPEGDPWQDEKRAVAMILTSGGYRICSGSMVNNVRQDGTRYFLTANHCLGGESSWIFMFNYESPTCSNINGPTYMTVQGSTLLANSSTSDFALLLLSEEIPASYGIYFAGWSNIDTPSQSSVGIHHPSGDIKKISFDYNPATSTDYLSSSGTTHWCVGNWEDGTTEGGSSGSPLFDQNHRVVGQLHGGYASCTSITPDWYGKFSRSWTGNGTSSTRLRNWLDPDNTGATTLDGFDPYAVVTITHTPLEDTRETVADYEVVCTIESGYDLVPDSLLLYYRTAAPWNHVTLTATGGTDEYHGYIPAQSPGSDIDYYLFARDITGNVDTTDTYSFRVIDYEVEMSPTSATGSGAVGDYVWYDLSVTNRGAYSDEFTLNYSGNAWTTSLWDETGSYEISSSGTLAVDESSGFKVRVEIPSSYYGTVDDITVTATSVGDNIRTAETDLATTSLGVRGAFPWQDSFPDLAPSADRWVYNSFAEGSTDALNPPSPPYALNLDGGRDTIISQLIDLDGQTELMLSLYYQQGGGGDDPDAGDYLWVDYRNNLGEWVNLVAFDGAEAAMDSFNYAAFALSADAGHDDFQLRLRSNGSTDLDDWFVDDIMVGYSPEIAVSPGSFNYLLGRDDSTEADLIIDNIGPGELHYELDIVPVFKKLSLVDELAATGQLAPAKRSYPKEYELYGESKGSDDIRTGFPVDKNAGGPDLFGYYWIDSDQSGGPAFEWIDVSGTGADIIGSLDDDNYSGPYSLGFDFPFYGEAYNEIYIGSNGIIGFDTTNMKARQKVYMPHPDTPNGIMAWLWDDLDPTDDANTDAHVYLDTDGSRCVIQFVDYPEYYAQTGDVVTAQVVIEANGTISYNYLTIATGFDTEHCSIGIENMAGDDGLNVAYLTPYLHDNLTIRFYMPLAWLQVGGKSGVLGSGEADTLLCRFISVGLDTGIYTDNIVITSNDSEPSRNPTVIPAELTVTAEKPYTCGDVDDDGSININDIVYLINFKYKDGSPPVYMNAADVNSDGDINLLDIIVLIQYKYKSGGEPNCP